MITLTPNIKSDFPEAFRVARRDKMRVVWLEDTLAYCARRESGHGRYLVNFWQDRDGQVKVDCHHVDGERCERMRFKKLCSHSAAVMMRGLAKRVKREERQDAA